ncbi:PQQ-dependent sugar dehydrogenase [Reichenbachiella ulvae]|uniref:PQQ-dependent sugar dehydrogenase n=1 Tax=Reichenbachiella ulvae TaxID=2980104 RepID=A0ABT3CNM1_9BACT|nr:PQQ-dependent sugar dehydrogenase [Reichenbachiella ulvae]MCV9385129.1 PQQ-dependent sugar dehydrogenase [Reichenbachiella ulvae]
MKSNIALIAIGIVFLFGACQKTGYDENSIPDEHRFTQEVFLKNLNEPVELEVLPNGQILYVERKGGIKLYDPASMSMILTDSIPVYYGFEDGLMGMALDPDFINNRWLYLYYSPPGEEAKQHLSRFTFDQNGIRDEKVMLVVPTQRDECCHTGGSIEFGSDGLLYLSTGDDTNPFKSNGYAPIDDNKEGKAFDARRTASNTNDLRGKILRIKPEADGSYTIPDGNLFVDDDPKTRPEIYVMGCRNPYRITVDQKRGWLFWGDVGPDAGDNDSIRGPRGHDEMNVAMTPGYYGWPMYIADNKPYAKWDFANASSGGFYDPENAVNESKYNTGIKNLPKPRPAMIFYPYSASKEFPMLTLGGRTAMTGPVFYQEKGMDSEIGFPSYFEQRLFIYDWMRNWIFTIEVDSTGSPSDFVPFMPSVDFNNIIDMDFGPDGTLYMIEYGTAWFRQNEDAKLSRIKFNRGNRTPVMNVNISQSIGSSPLEVTLDASSSIDHDGDALEFVWKLGDKEIEGPVFNHTFEANGVYYPRLSLRDEAGNWLMESFKIEVGNDAPEISIALEGNQSLYWPGREINYQVNVSDKQDGSLGNGIAREEVNFDIQYMDGLDQSQILGHQLPVSSGELLISESDCMSCHKVNDKSVGPSFVQVADRYQGDANAMNYLTSKIIKGGSGAWGDHSMSAHPDFTQEEVVSMIEYIFTLNQEKEALKPLQGSYIAKEDEYKKELVFSAQYADKGGMGLSSISRLTTLQLKPNQFMAGMADSLTNAPANRRNVLNRVYNQAIMQYPEFDLTDIAAIAFNMNSAVDNEIKISIHIDSEDGEKIGQLIVNQSDSDWTERTIPIKKTSGKHKTFVRIESDLDDKVLLKIRTIKFIPNELQD